MGLTHFNEEGRAKMVDVSTKDDTKRTAVAKGTIKVSPEIMDHIISGKIKKGDVLGTAQIAGVMGAKKTSDIIPMCHPLFITGVDISFEKDLDQSLIHAYATVSTIGKTGVEMEALSAVSVTLLTIYDMCKALDKGMVIDEIKLISKSGGKSGNFERGDK